MSLRPDRSPGRCESPNVIEKRPNPDVRNLATNAVLLEELVDFLEQPGTFEYRPILFVVLEIVPDHPVLIDDEQVRDVDVRLGRFRIEVGNGHLSHVEDD